MIYPKNFFFGGGEGGGVTTALDSGKMFDQIQM